MDSNVTIVMYHYVRELRSAQYPKIKALSSSQFIGQLDYIQKYYEVITISDLIDAFYSNTKLPKNAILLTFDDAYSDHFTNVYPILKERNLQGCFFIPAKPILQNKVLDTNKIHFILASVSSIQHILDDIKLLINKYRSDYHLEKYEQYFARLAKPSRYDTKEIVFVKRLLQDGLPKEIREIILDELFNKYVSTDEGAFSKELYMTVEQLQYMQRNGMYIGSHGYDHYRLGELDVAVQEEEIDLSLDFLKTVGSDINNWVMCYPYGSYNDSLIKILKRKNCKLAFTTEVDIATIDLENVFSIPRLDTNDLPKRGDATPNEWFTKLDIH